MPRGRGSSVSGGGSMPPVDMGPGGNELRIGQRIEMEFLRGDKKPGETMARARERTTPNIMKVENVPPFFYEDFAVAEIEITGITGNKKMGFGRIVGPAEVLRAAEEGLRTVLEKSKQYWEKTIGTGPFALPVGRIEKKEKDKDKVFFDVVYQDEMNNYEHVTLELRIVNLPKDWTATPDQKFLNVQLKKIEIRDGKRLSGHLIATDFEDRKSEPGKVNEKLVEDVSKIQGWIDDGSFFQFNIEHFKQNCKKDKRGKWTYIYTLEEVDFELSLDVPEDWSPEQLALGKGIYKVKDNEGKQTDLEEVVVNPKKVITTRDGKIILFSELGGVEPPKRKTREEIQAERDQAAAAEAVRQAAAREERAREAAGVLAGKSILSALKNIMTPEILAAVEQLVTEMDRGGVAQDEELERKMEIFEAVEAELKKLKRVVAPSVDALDEEGVMQKLNAIAEQQKKIVKEKERVSGLLAKARAVLATQLARTDTARAERERLELESRQARRQENQEEFDEVAPRVEEAVVVREVDEVLDLGDVADLAKVLQLQAENQHVLDRLELFLDSGKFRKKGDDPRKTFEDFVFAVLLAKKMVPRFADRIQELEGTPTPAAPPLPPPVTGAPAARGVGAGRERVATVVEAELDNQEMREYLDTYGFTAGKSVGFEPQFLRRMEKMFTLPEALPARLTLVGVTELGVEFSDPESDEPSLTIPVVDIYKMVEQRLGLVHTLGEAGKQNVVLELNKDAVDTFLKPKFSEWLAAHAGKSIPNKLRVRWVDVVTGQIVVKVEGVPEMAEVRLNLEQFVPFVVDKKVSVVEATKAIAAEQASLQPPPEVSAEGDLLVRVKKGQMYVYSGNTLGDKPEDLKKGKPFVVTRVDLEAGVVQIVTAEEYAAARSAQPPRVAKGRQVKRETWKKLLDERIIEISSKSPVPLEAEKASKLPVVAQIFTYPGLDRGPFKKDDEILVTSVDAEGLRITFKIYRLGEDQKPFRLPLEQWNSLGLRLRPTGAVPLVPTPAVSRAAADTPPVPPALRVPVPAPPLASRVPSPTLPDVVTASFPPTIEPMSTPPGSVQELLDLLRRKEVRDLVLQVAKGKAGKLGGFVGDIVRMIDDKYLEVVNLLERTLTKSGTVLPALEDQKRIAESKSRFIWNDLRAAETLYRNTEAATMLEFMHVFNGLLQGKAPADIETELKSKIQKIDQALDVLKRSVDQARAQLQTPPPTLPTALRKKT